MERVWRTHAAAAGCHIHLTLASADVDTPERMTAEECVSKYTHKNYPMTESDKLKLVDALISGLRSNAIIVHYLPWGRFLLRWRTTAIAAAKLHVAGDAFRSSNSALPERFQQASLCYRSRQKTSNDGVKQHMDEVGSEYRRVAQIAVKDGNKTSGDNEAYRYQLSEWDLDELLIEGRVPDVRTAQFILAVLEAARNITLAPPLSARPALREPLSSQSTHSPSLVAGSSLSASSSSSQPSSLSSQCSPSYSPPSSQSTHSSSRMASGFLSACSTSYNLSPLSSLGACSPSYNRSPLSSLSVCSPAYNPSPLSSLSCSANPSPVTPAFDGIDMELDDPFSPSRLSSSLDAWSPFGSPSRWPDAGPQKTTQSPASSDVSQSSVIPPEADMGSPTDDCQSERRKQGGAKRTSGGAEPARKRQSTFVETYGDVLFGYGVENGAE